MKHDLYRNSGWVMYSLKVHCKKWFAVFLSLAGMSLTKPSLAGMSLTKPSLAGNDLIILGSGEFDKWHPGWGLENR